VKKLLLAGVAALSLLGATEAHAVEYQGNLPKPVQKLPAYPPVACVALDWSIESCGDRQTPLPHPNPLRAFARRAPESITVLYDEPGGDYWEHWRRFKALADSGNDVEIRGSCASGCTVIMIHVPSDRLCFGEGASLQFHIARNGKTGTPDLEFTRDNMVNQYPQDIRAWIIAKGGVEKMNIQQMWKLDASELWDMGYRKCEKNYLPQWNITEAEREKWRMMDEKAEEAWKEWQKSRDPDFKDAAWNKRTWDAPP